MTTRLPIPGSDDGTWGQLLNDFLSQAHNPDGTLKPIDPSQVTNLASDLAAKADASALALKADASALALKADLTDLATKADVSALATKVDASALATVATSGSYTDLTNQPVIPDTSSMVAGNGITTVQQLTQAAYDALSTKNSATLYVIVG